ncbi:hypothetical protein GCM10010177_79020 [Actinomadura citrea]|nr:hypothetical protein GCM10010177_79020 [Actinomadura citrea]
MRPEVGGVHVLEGALLGTDGGTDRADDVRLGHYASKNLGFRPETECDSVSQYEITSSRRDAL